MSRPIGALWLRKSSNGIQYMSGVLNDLAGDIQIAIFKNDRKEKENQPDYRIVLSEKKGEAAPRTQEDSFFGASSSATASTTSNYPEDNGFPPAPGGDEEIRVENIPF
jgi:uncharacterized protein (DUF736 family)